MKKWPSCKFSSLKNDPYNFSLFIYIVVNFNSLVLELIIGGMSFLMQLFHQQLCEPLIDEFSKLGGIKCGSPKEAGKGKAIFDSYLIRVRLSSSSSYGLFVISNIH